MADQATVKRSDSAAVRPGTLSNGTGESAGTGKNGAASGDLVGNVAEFGESLLTLGELQARLAALEFKQNIEAGKVGGAIGLTGAILALASLPLVLAGAGELLVSELGMRRGFAFLVVGVVTLAL